MRKKPVKLPGEYYFSREIVPCTVVKVHGDALSHEHNYTGIPHWHDFSELVILTSGSGRQNINGVSYPVSVGDVFVISGKTTHYFEEYRNLEIVNILFVEHVFQVMREYLNRLPGYQLIFRFEPELRTSKEFHNTLHLSADSLAHAVNIIRKMEAELSRRDPGYEAVMVTYLFDLVIFLSRCQENGRGNQPITRLADLFSKLEATFQEEWTLERMAKHANMSVNTLLRNFQAAAKQTPLNYLTSLRLNAAGLMLVNTDRAVSEIAYLCGFRDSNYFTKRFQKYYKMTPSSFRSKGKT
ncbi:MAG: helix-turn-helix domain-containing protein [Lentisphaerae bacterium]|nr:helix-turn-helix domain-containing protein [Lentisphaerota bacterium]